MFKEKIYPNLLVTVQLGSLLYLAISGTWVAGSALGLMVESFGIGLGILAIYVAGIHNVNIRPLPKEGGKLITYGPYYFIRHPMYLAQVVAFIPLVVTHYTPLRLAVILALTVALLLKMPYEEKGLIGQFGEDYKTYMSRTKKVIPFIY
ncbi:MAG: isoprenylcysteine carboxylmethyltransferase family protein [Bacteroidales bacterium]|nr:isoprenylcysteine carboxylmethyltransferase family protein [Bacteroidales bacterium]